MQISIRLGVGVFCGIDKILLEKDLLRNCRVLRNYRVTAVFIRKCLMQSVYRTFPCRFTSSAISNFHCFLQLK